MNNLKATNEFLAQENSRISSQKIELEAKIASQQEIIQKLDESNTKNKQKIDYVITFCNLLDQTDSFMFDHNGKLNELPSMLVAYLKGEVSELSFKSQKSCMVNDNSGILSTNSDYFDEKVSECRSLRSELGNVEETTVISRDIEELKDTMKQMLQSLNKMNKVPASSSDRDSLRHIEANTQGQTFKPLGNNSTAANSPVKRHVRSKSKQFYFPAAHILRVN